MADFHSPSSGEKTGAETVENRFVFTRFGLLGLFCMRCACLRIILCGKYINCDFGASFTSQCACWMHMHEHSMHSAWIVSIRSSVSLFGLDLISFRSILFETSSAFAWNGESAFTAYVMYVYLHFSFPAWWWNVIFWWDSDAHNVLEEDEQDGEREPFVCILKSWIFNCVPKWIHTFEALLRSASIIQESRSLYKQRVYRLICSCCCTRIN